MAQTSSSGRVVQGCSIALIGWLAVLLVCVGSGCMGPHAGYCAAVRFEWAEEAEARLAVVEKDLASLQIRLDILAAAGWKHGMPEDAFMEWFLRTDEVTKDVLFDARGCADRFRAGLNELWAATGHCCFVDIPPDEVVDKGTDILARYREFIARNSGEPRKQLLRKGLRELIQVLLTAHCREAVEMIREIVLFERVETRRIDGIDYITRVETAIYSHGGGEVEPHKRQELFEVMTRWLRDNEKSLSWNPLSKCFTRNGAPFDPPDPLWHFQ